MIAWNTYPVGFITKVTPQSYVLRTKKVVSDLDPISEEVYSDPTFTLVGYYNRRGLIVGYELTFEGTPLILEDSFYVVLDYVSKKHKPTAIEFPKLGGKEDPSICLAKYGGRLANSMYVFIYRRKKDG